MASNPGKDRARKLHSAFVPEPLELRRYPAQPGADLMAWDAADEYLLGYCAHDLGAALDLTTAHILLCDDQFGALTCGLAPYACTSVHHSACAHTSIAHNLTRNGLAASAPQDWLSLSAERQFDLVLLRLPKSLDLMAEYCRRLRPLLREGAVVLGGAMDKYLSKNMLAVLSAKMGPTHTTLGRKKARLSVTRVGPAPDSARPQRQRYRAEPFDLYVTSLPGTFSAQKLDVGTRFLLEHFAQIPIASSRTIADLGCGNGILGVVAAALNPGANVSFFDDSSFAIASARLSVAANFAAEERFDFNHADGLLPDADRLFDVVLCNPPFHLGGQQDTFVAQRLFAQASKALHPDGELWVVGNRHLRYHTSLRRHFVDVSVVASNRKFLLLRARQPRPRHAGASIQSRNE